MISNPISSPLFVHIALLIVGILSSTLLILLIAERHHLRPREFYRRPLLQRWLVWAVLAPLYTFTVLGGQVPRFYSLLCSSFRGSENTPISLD